VAEGKVKIGNSLIEGQRVARQLVSRRRELDGHRQPVVKKAGWEKLDEEQGRQ
jgi:hypothetical protein